MADSVTIGSATGVKVSSEEITLLDGTTVSAEQVQRVIPMFQSGNSTVVTGTGLAHKLDKINDNLLAWVPGYSYGTNISTNATTTFKTGSGVLRGFIVGDPGTAWQAAFYDNTAGSGTNPFTIKFAAAGFITCDAGFSTGGTLVTTGTTPGNFVPIFY